MDRIHARKTELACAEIRDNKQPLRPGVAELVGEAWANGIKLGLVTSTYRENIEAIAEGGGLDLSTFDTVISVEGLTRPKPDPEAYRIALQQLGVSADEAVAVEDSQPSLQSAKAAGLRVLAVPGAFTAEQDFSAAEWRADSLAAAGRPWAAS